LHDSGSLVGAVREIAVVAAGNAEHADEVRNAAQCQGCGSHLDAGEQNGKAGEVDGYEWKAFQPTKRRRAGRWRPRAAGAGHDRRLDDRADGTTPCETKPKGRSPRRRLAGQVKRGGGELWRKSPSSGLPCGSIL